MSPQVQALSSTDFTDDSPFSSPRKVEPSEVEAQGHWKSVAPTIASQPPALPRFRSTWAFALQGDPDATAPNCGQVRVRAEKAKAILNRINWLLSEIERLSKFPKPTLTQGSRIHAARMELQGLQKEIEETYPASFDAPDRLLTYVWSIDFKYLLGEREFSTIKSYRFYPASIEMNDYQWHESEGEPESGIGVLGMEPFLNKPAQAVEHPYVIFTRAMSPNRVCLGDSQVKVTGRMEIKLLPKVGNAEETHLLSIELIP
jgi:hypothetical protein